MNTFNKTTEFEHADDSRLFNHYRQFFDENVVEEFRRKHDLDNSYKGYKALMPEIEIMLRRILRLNQRMIMLT